METTPVKCPNCDLVPMNFWWFLLLGWIRMKCPHCAARLRLVSVGERFWRTLAAGAVILATIFFFVDYPFQRIGAQGTLALFIVLVIGTLLSAVYFAWKDSQYELYRSSDQ
jgi:hypothetical protein